MSLGEWFLMFLRVVVCLKILENEATAPLQTFGSHTITQHFIPEDLNAQETFCYYIWLVLKKKKENEDWFKGSHWVSFVTIWFWAQGTWQQCDVYNYAFINRNQVNIVVKSSAIPLFYFTHSTTIIAEKVRRFNCCLRNSFSLYLFVLSWPWLCQTWN